MISRPHVNTLIRLAAVAVVVAACAAKGRRTDDDTLVVVIETPMNTADPRFTVSSYDTKLSRLVTAGLTTVEAPDLEPRLLLAERYERIDPLTIDFTLRPDAKFSDGSPVLASDVVTTFDTVLARGSKSMHSKAFTERFVRIEARSERVVRFHLVEPLGTLLSDLDFGIVSPKGLGAGPYVLRELTATHALLEANPYYFGPAPKVPRVDIRFVRDASARLLMLVGGSADLLQNAVRMDLVEEVRGRPRVQIATAPSVVLTYLMMNTSDPLLAKREVRQAIALALDRPAIIRAKFGGHARLASSLMSTFHWAYNKDLPTWDHDLRRAGALLDAAGFPDPDGAGPEPRLKLIYKTSSDAFRVAVARVVAAQLAEVGIDVEVRSFEFATFFADVKKGSFQLASMQTSELSEPDYYYFYFHSSRIPSEANPDGGNRWRYANPALDRAVEAGRRELDPAKRKPFYDEAQRIIATDLPIITLWHEDTVVMTNAGVHGFHITPNARFIGLIGTWKE